MTKLNTRYIITFSVDPNDVWVKPTGSIKVNIPQYKLPEDIEQDVCFACRELFCECDSYPNKFD